MLNLELKYRKIELYVRMTFVELTLKHINTPPDMYDSKGLRGSDVTPFIVKYANK